MLKINLIFLWLLKNYINLNFNWKLAIKIISLNLNSIFKWYSLIIPFSLLIILNLISNYQKKNSLQHKKKVVPGSIITFIHKRRINYCEEIKDEQFNFNFLNSHFKWRNCCRRKKRLIVTRPHSQIFHLISALQSKHLIVVQFHHQSLFLSHDIFNPFYQYFFLMEFPLLKFFWTFCNFDIHLCKINDTFLSPLTWSEMNLRRHH